MAQTCGTEQAPMVATGLRGDIRRVEGDNRVFPALSLHFLQGILVTGLTPEWDEEDW